MKHIDWAKAYAICEPWWRWTVSLARGVIAKDNARTGRHVHICMGGQPHPKHKRRR